MEIATLRHERLRSLTAEHAPQIVGQRRSLAHREDARFGSAMGQHGDAIAGAEDAIVAGRAQRIVDGQEAALVERQAGIGEPWRGTRPR